MSSITLLPVPRYTKDFEPCTYGSAEEVGWFGLVNSHKDPDAKEYVADKGRRLLRTLADHYKSLANVELDNRWKQFHDHNAAFLSGNSRPFFHVLTWIRDNQEIFNKLKPQVICHPRALLTLLEVPNLVRGHGVIDFVACKREGVIFLTHLNTEPEEADITSYRLHRCEQLVTFMSDSSEKDQETGINTFEYFYSVLSRMIGKTRILYAQKVDCGDSRNGNPPESYVNVDLVENITPFSDNMPFCIGKHQSMDRSAWARCFVSGAHHELRGTRTKSTLDHWELIAAENIPDSNDCYKPQCAHWNKERNISFLNEFLEFVQKVAVDDYTRAVYGFNVDVKNKKTFTMGAYKWDVGRYSVDIDLWHALRRWDNTEHPDSVKE